FCFVLRPAALRSLRSFPTRRSSDLGQSDAANIAAPLDAMSTVTLSEEDSSLDGSVESAPGSTGESFDASAPHTENEFPPDASSADRKSTRLNSSHVKISYAVFCLKK